MNIQQQYKLVKLGVVVAMVIIATTMLMDDTLSPRDNRSIQGEDVAFRSMIVPTEGNDPQDNLAATDPENTSQAEQLVARQPEIKVVTTKPAEPEVTEAAEDQLVEEQEDPEIAAVMAELAAQEELEIATISAASSPTPPIETADKNQAPALREVITPKLGKEKPTLLISSGQQITTMRLAPSTMISTKITPLDAEQAAPVLPTGNSVPQKAWVVQLGSFGDVKNAIGLRNKLRKNGFMSFVESINIKGKQSARVYVGPVTELSKAQMSLKNLEKDFKTKGLIVEYGL
ncbi:hypothetical protein MNBD_GAMMA26-948 [hydrothermal vent metagenome]|uniref:SPOR domain-containing protein n=1 Tax=hydrothermal vent metagenome TaxID=652676 RepID=A0A3B1BNC8_9ZZZZ